MADPAGGRLNVNRHIADPYYRYKMPAAAVTDPHPRRKVIKDKAKKRNNKRMTKRERRQADREPREKRIHRPAAVISNGDAIADSLNRPISLVARYLAHATRGATAVETQWVPGMDRDASEVVIVLAAAVTRNAVQDAIYDFIDAYVLCRSCANGSPETVIEVCVGPRGTAAGDVDADAHTPPAPPMRMTCESCGSVSRHIDSDDALAGAIADIAWAKRAEDAAVDAARGREGGSDSGNLEPEQAETLLDGTSTAGMLFNTTQRDIEAEYDRLRESGGVVVVYQDDFTAPPPSDHSPGGDNDDNGGGNDNGDGGEDSGDDVYMTPADFEARTQMYSLQQVVAAVAGPSVTRPDFSDARLAAWFERTRRRLCGSDTVLLRATVHVCLVGDLPPSPHSSAGPNSAPFPADAAAASDPFRERVRMFALMLRTLGQYEWLGEIDADVVPAELAGDKNVAKVMAWLAASSSSSSSSSASSGSAAASSSSASASASDNR